MCSASHQLATITYNIFCQNQISCFLIIKIIDERLTLFNGSIDVYVLDSER